MFVDQQTIKDLEFDQIRAELALHCKLSKGKQNAANITPFGNLDGLKKEFTLLDEISQIFAREDINFPHPSAQNIDNALKVLRVENGVLVLHELLRVYTLCLGTEELINFSNKYRDILPAVYELCSQIQSVELILKIIKSVLNKHLKIDDNASKELAIIRRQVIATTKEIDKNFDAAIRHYRKEGFLDDTIETTIDNTRLLSVVHTHKRKVKGAVKGISAKGNLVYIEPENNIKLNQRKAALVIEERNEIYKILSAVTNELRAEKKHLAAFERLLVRFDLLNAKVLLAEQYGGIIPKITTALSFKWTNALHPILLMNNQKIGKKTIGQEFELHAKQRFLVISGPNAGGKSITMKTVGLLQLMFQSGLLVPTDSNSEFCWFDKLLSDIGDNQNIENQLSTYSYRLSRMKLFLKELNSKSLVLLDEFGSGSDPELGGALAEVFFEEMYDSQCFAIVNTHYTSIKILTSKKEEAVNASMLFDTQNLHPLFKLSVGQPGSSFTFEVARNKGIKEDLIERAKQKVSDQKINLDQLSVDLQRKKTQYEKANKKQHQESRKATQLIEEYESKLEELYQKTSKHKLYFEQQEKHLRVGKKVFELIGKHKHQENNKLLNLAVKKLIAIEKNKVLSEEKPIAIAKEVEAVKIEEPKSKKQSKPAKQKPKEKPTEKIKVGDQIGRAHV